MNMNNSIVIPTFNHCDDLLKPCIESVLKYTNLSDTEIIVVANGCKDGTKDYLLSIPNIRTLWFDEGIGYTKATNEGIKIATGKYIVLINNDVVLLEQTRNQWIETLTEPFKDPKIGITGPMKVFSPPTQRDFIIFFCACIRKELFDKVGLLDESFSPGFGEDTDFCRKAEDVGYSIFQVNASHDYYSKPGEVPRMVGGFPIYHKGHETFKELADDSAIINRNTKILEDRWGSINITKALEYNGYMSESELKWLAKEAKVRKVIIEVGSWHGRSTRALGDNACGVVYAVDHFGGSKSEVATGHASAQWENGDHAFMEFCDNNLDLIQRGKIIPLRGSSVSMAKMLKRNDVKADMIFIDAGHDYEEVKEDIEHWKDLLNDNGILCGHDIQAWAGVGQAVEEELHQFYVGQHTTIWYCEKKDIKMERSMIYDCFIFNDEFDMLETRMSELWDVVDRFVIVEMGKTHSNHLKPFHLRDNFGRFEKYFGKMSHVMVDDYPSDPTPWNMAQHQREAMMRALTQCKDSDTIIIADIDEIPAVKAIKNYRPEDGIKSFDMDFFYYNMETKSVNRWTEAKILPYSLLKKIGPPGARYSLQSGMVHGFIPNGGRHLSYFGGVDAIIKKLEDFADQEYNRPEFRDREHIENAIKEGKDLLDRKDVLFSKEK